MGEVDLGFHLEGSNPDVYDGYPVRFNMRLEAPLLPLLRGVTTGSRVTEALEKAIEKGLKEGP